MFEFDWTSFARRTFFLIIIFIYLFIKQIRLCKSVDKQYWIFIIIIVVITIVAITVGSGNI